MHIHDPLFVIRLDALMLCFVSVFGRRCVTECGGPAVWNQSACWERVFSSHSPRRHAVSSLIDLKVAIKNMYSCYSLSVIHYFQNNTLKVVWKLLTNLNSTCFCVLYAFDGICLLFLFPSRDVAAVLGHVGRRMVYVHRGGWNRLFTTVRSGK